MVLGDISGIQNHVFGVRQSNLPPIEIGNGKGRRGIRSKNLPAIAAQRFDDRK
jgi:hypothetical protein